MLLRFYLVASLALVFVTTSAFAKLNDLDYLPKNQKYNPAIPSPSSTLGNTVGEWHARHDQIVEYMRALAKASDRVELVETGRTHENRPLILLTITAPKNMQRLEQIKQDRQKTVAEGTAPKADAPLIINMGYSVHGNESSGANASLLVAYYLAASESADVTKLLDENVILIDPVLNPDGLSRFAQWANMHKGRNLVADPSHREHTEYWPSGRTNHYWFDLNRDWLLLTHPESKARVAKFHEWRPHIVTDFHEMGSNSTYFFQPGIESRKNPYTPNENVDLTGALAEFHAKALDKDKQLYFTRESFDDFYFGKGSTYPDAHGSVGILFEQASSRGHLQESINGLLSFQRSIQNQVTTSISTFTGAMANKSSILEFQKRFYDDTKSLAQKDKVKGILVGKTKDNTRFSRMLDILDRHHIKFELLDEDVSLDKTSYSAGSVFVPLDQPQYRLIKSLFSTQKSFRDNTFYDVSNWNIALAFNLPYQELSRSSIKKLSLVDWTVQPEVESNIVEDEYAYAFEWFDANAPAMLQALLEDGVNASVAGAEFRAKTISGERDFAKGTVLIPTALSQPDSLASLLREYTKRFNIKVYTITSGLTSKGVDLGSRMFSRLKAPQVLIVGGQGTSAYEVGEMWHYLDTRVGIPATLWDVSRLNRSGLSRYTHILFASGSYSSLKKSTVSRITKWIEGGGVVIGQKSALRWFASNEWIDNEIVSKDILDSAFSDDGLRFADKQALAAKKLVAGAAYNSRIDTSHPLFFGYELDSLALFKTSNFVLGATDNPFKDVAVYTDDALLAGYSADEMKGLINESAAIVVNTIGDGQVIGFVDNIHFRGYWDGTNKLTANAIYMSGLF